MKRLACWLACASTILMANQAFTQPIEVKSGEHGSFTRLVLSMPRSARWQLTGIPGQQQITVENHTDGFNLSGVFSVIPRKRLTELTSSGSTLTLTMPCDCKIEQFIDKERYLVLDILDGRPLPLESSVEAAPTGSKQATSFKPNSSFAYGDLLWQNQQPSIDDNPTDVADQSTSKPVSEDSAAGRAFSEIRDQLVSDVSSAVSRGVLTPSLPDIDLSTSIIADVPIYDSSAEAPTLQSEPQQQIRITSSLDVPPSIVSLNLTEVGASCPNADFVKLNTWGTSEDFNSQLSQARESLFGELGSLDNQQVLDSTKLLIFFGFGAEARETLLLLESSANDHPALLDLSDIMEFGYARNPRILHRFLECDSDLAFWAIMSGRKIPNDQPVNVDASLRSLARLPTHLQKYLGPILSRRLAEYGEHDAAATAIRIAQRQEVPENYTADLALAAIDIENGNRASALNALDSVASSNSSQAPEALIALVNSKVETNETIPAETALLIESYAHQLRKSSLGPELFRAHVIASAKSGQFEKAFNLLNSSRASQRNDLKKIKSISVRNLTDFADDFDFLENTFAELLGQIDTIDEEAALAAADRLVSLGFYDLAAEIVTPIPASPANSHRQRLLAKIALASQDAPLALNLLQNLEGDEIETLRAQAHAQNGENSSAAEIYRSLNDTDNAIHAAWMAEDWSELTPSDDPQFGPIQELAQEDLPMIATGDGMLARSAAAIEESEAARELLNGLLESLEFSNFNTVSN